MGGFNVQAPDGKVIQFPASMSQNDVQSAMQKLYPPKQDLSAQNAVIDKMLAENPQPKPYYGFSPSNVLSNILGGVKSAVGGTASLGKDLISNPNWIEGKDSTFHKFIEQPSENENIKAGESLNKGETIPALGHGLASALPFLGPWAASLGEQAGKGDVGGATGQAIGTLGAAKLASKTGAAIDSIPRTGRAGVAFQDVMSKARNIPVDLSKAGDSALAIKDLADRGGSMPMAVRKFLMRTTSPNSPPLNYEEARDFYSNVSRLSADESMRLTPVMKRAVGQFRADLGQSIQDAASKVGKGEQYKGAMSEYSKASKLKDVGEDLKNYAWQSTKRVLPWIPVAYAIGKIGDILK